MTDEYLTAKAAAADDTYGWLLAYMESGFSRDEAMRLLLASLSRPTAQAFPPEMLEFLVKSSLLAERALEE